MWEKCSEDLSKINACNREELIDGWVKRIPLKRLAQPADIANSILFLCSKEGEYITGQTINVCGGLSIA